MTTLIDTISFLKNGPESRVFSEMRFYVNRKFPLTMQAFRIIDDTYSQGKKRKGFNLVKRENKKLGFVYYVRYSHKGKMLPTKWNTHTNILEEAERFAHENKERLVAQYLGEHDKRGLEIFKRFYEESSEYLSSEEKRNRSISDTTRRNYHSVINNKFLPYINKQGINSYEKITIQVLSDFQDYYLASGIKPQTVNDYLKAIKKVLHYLSRKGHISENPYIKNLPVHESDKIMRDCYELKDIYGIFSKRWHDQMSYLLCLLIYTTGMRNSEIKEITMNDIVILDGCRFINVKKSKTQNGIRMVPLHEKVYQKIKAFAEGKGRDEKLFKKCSSITFSDANKELARIVKASNKKVKTEGITFYSGRHYWKTLMNSEELGEDVEEIFMGHKVSNDVAKLYNHRDKQGKQRMIKKAKRIFSILEKTIFV